MDRLGSSCGNQYHPSVWSIRHSMAGDLLFLQAPKSLTGDKRDGANQSSWKDKHVDALTRFDKIHSLREDRLERSPITMMEALYRTRHASSTDPKNKLSALLGLVYDGTNFIPHPDYNLSKEEVYRKFSIALLENGYPLDLIRIRSAKQKVDTSLPSWTVDWSDLHDDLARNILRAFKGLSLSDSYLRRNWTIKGDTLTVRGIIIGRISTMSLSSGHDVHTAELGARRSLAIPPGVRCLELSLFPGTEAHSRNKSSMRPGLPVFTGTADPRF